jgi:RNase P/RNase MRP subunit p29
LRDRERNFERGERNFAQAGALESHYPTQPQDTTGTFVHPRLSKSLSKAAIALICVAAVFAAGCHRQGNTSFYGIAWVDVTAAPAPQYAAYIVTIDSITLTRSDDTIYTAVATPEVVDLTQIHNFAELWSSGAIPDGTYVSATITLDYTPIANGGVSQISVRDGDVPVTASVLDAATKLAPTTYSITVQFDPLNQPTITPTYASTSAALMALDIDLPASGYIDNSTSPPTVYIRPYVSIGKPADTKLIRVRGPLANSSVDVNTYTVYIRPFYDEANNIGQVTLFSQPTTVYTLNGQTYIGQAGCQKDGIPLSDPRCNSGLDALSVLSAGSTMTAGFTTFQPDYNPSNGAYAGRFNLQYVVAGSTLEDVYTNGISGDVVARTGNTLTLRGSTLIVTTDDTFEYEVADCTVLLGAGTLVTADDNPLLTNLTESSIAVGDHISARGIYIQSPGATNAAGSCGEAIFGETVELDSTGTSATNTGSVRLQPNEAFGTLVSTAPGNVVMDLASIDYWPAAAYDFAGNGATTPVPTAFSVNTEGLTLPAGTVAGDPIWVSGYAPPFGAAPPDYLSFALNNELSVQTAGGALGGGVPTTPGSGGCGVGSQVCDPAVLSVNWTAGTTTPFTTFSDQSFIINLSNAAITTATIQIGSESLAMSSLPSSPVVVPTPNATTETFAPRYSWGVPHTSTTTSTSTTAATTQLNTSSSFSTFVTGVNATLVTAAPAEQLVARGIYDRATNTFTATQIDFAL